MLNAGLWQRCVSVDPKPQHGFGWESDLFARGCQDVTSAREIAYRNSLYGAPKRSHSACIGSNCRASRLTLMSSNHF
jgi:hypothetical protein